MLTHIDTGYEGKFDFPTRQPGPDFTYLLASVPRAGSTHFSHLLWRTCCLGAPLEYLNFQPAGPYGFAAASPQLQLELWRSVLRRRCSPNGVFGLKAFAPQLDELQRKNPLLLGEVWRQCFLAPGLGASFTSAAATGLHRSFPMRARRCLASGARNREGEAAQTIKYSDEALEAADRGIAFQEAVWERMFDELGIEPLTVRHEDVLSDGPAGAHAVASYLGAKIDKAAVVDVPPIEKQSEGDAGSWAARHSA